MSLEEIRNKLIDLYLSVKVRKSEDIKNVTQEYINKERKGLKKIGSIDIINYIQNSIEILVEMRATEKYEEKLEKDEEKNGYINKEDPHDVNGLKLYEGMLINAEKKIREHIRVRILFIILNNKIIQNEQELKLVIEELEGELKAINNKNNNKYKKNNEEENDYDNKYKNEIFRPNNSGLINHLKKENERLRKLVISYEFKNKKYNNINNIYNTNNNNFLISKSYFEILKKKKDINKNQTHLNTNNNTNQNTNKSKDKKQKKIISRDYKYNFSNKSIGAIQKNKNFTKIIKKQEIKKVKDINMFDNDFNYIKEKENKLKKFNYIKIYNNTLQDRTGSSWQRKRKIFNMNMGNNSINTNTLRVKNIVNPNNSKVINSNFLEQYRNLSVSRSLSKIIKKKRLNDYSINNSIKLEKKAIGSNNPNEQRISLIKNQSIKNKVMKTIENKRNDNSSLDKDIFYSSTSRQQKHSQIIKRKSKNKELNKDSYYQKPIINKITIYNNINNGYNFHKQKIHLNGHAGKLIFGKKQSYNKLERNFNNFTLGIY